MSRSTWDFGRAVGHLAASDQAVSLDHLLATRQLEAGDHVLLLGVGPGVTISSAVVQILNPPPGARAHERPDIAMVVEPVAVVGIGYPGDPVLRLASGLGEIVLDGAPPRHILADLTYDPAQDVVDVVIADADDGRVIARIAGLRYTSMEGGSAASAAPRQLVHELAWRPLDLPESGRERTAVIVAPDARAGAALRDRLAEAGITASVTASPEGLAEFDAPADVPVLPARFTQAGTNGAGSAGSAVTEAAARSVWLLAATAKRLATTPSPPRLWCLTSGVMEAAEERSLAHAPLWGLGRVLAGEHPEMWGGIVDLDPHGDADGLDRILAAHPREDVLTLRGGAASASRLARLTGEPPGRDLECRAGGTYLITGGLGALGLEIARWLAGRGARRIVLAGRTPVPARADWDAHDEWRARVDGVRESTACAPWRPWASRYGC